MNKLYYSQPYLKSVMCSVTSVNHTPAATEVLTDSTVFYPESGGQPGDRGMLGPYRVLDTRKSDTGESILILEKDSPVMQGDTLVQVLDWEHRYKFMVIHTSQHLLSGLMYNLFGIGTVAVHQGEDYLTIETDKSEIPQETVDAIVMAANDAITEAHSVSYCEMTHKEAEDLGMRRSIKVDGDVRVVEIEGIDKIACGGVHVGNTRELRIIQAIYHEQIRGHVRLYFQCGKQALENVLSNTKLVRSLGVHLSCKDNEIEQKVTELQSTLNNVKYEREKLQRSLASYQIRENTDENSVCIMDLPEGTDLVPFAQAVTSHENLAMLLLCPDAERTKWLIALKGSYERVDFNALRGTLLSKINAKGGGKSPVFQGVAACNDINLLKDFKEQFRKAL